MAYNFLDCDRHQQYLMPPSLADWLPEDHLAWFIIDAVEQMDLSAFYLGYRDDGWGRAAHAPSMMTTLMLYAYCIGVRSSRQIERACHVDIAFRVIAANHTPDHTTIARFRQRHETALAELFNQSLRLCAEAGLAKAGLVALDGTKMGCPAALSANRTKDSIDAEVDKMLSEAEAVDSAEDQLFGSDSNGDEPPAALRGKAARRARLVEAKARLDAEAAEAARAHEEHLAERAAKEAEMGRKLGGRKPKPPAPPQEAKANTSDPDSRVMKTPSGYVQGYNAQATVNEDQVILGAEVTQDANDVAQLRPMVEVTEQNLADAGVDDGVDTVVADSGYWSEANASNEQADGPEVIINTKKGKTQRRAKASTAHNEPVSSDASARQRMDAVLSSDQGRDLYAKRSQMVEPVFGQMKDARGARRFMRRGRSAADAEWKLLCGTHNLLKLFRRALQDVSAAPWARLAITPSPGMAC